MPCNEALQLQTYFDGELDAAAALGVERHLESCADCAALLADLEHARKLVRASGAYHRADHGLGQRIVDQIGRERSDGRRSVLWFAPDHRFLSGLGSGAAATALAAVIVYFLAAPPAPNAPLTTDLVNAHLRSLMSD